MADSSSSTRVLTGTLVRQRVTAAPLLDGVGCAGQPVLEHSGLNEYPGDELYEAYSGRDRVEHQRADFRGYWRTFREAMLAWSQDRLQGVPETFYVAKNGDLRGLKVGPLSPPELDEVIDELLAEPYNEE